MALHIGDEGLTYYAKPNPITATPSWDDDAIELTPNAADGRVFTFAGTRGVVYIIYEQAGEEPAASDELVNVVPADATIAVSVPALEDEESETDAQRTRYRGTHWSLVVEDIAAEPTKVYATIKRANEPDAKAILQAVVTDPAAGTDGLLILNGATAATLGNATLAIESYLNDDDETRYRVTLTVLAVTTAEILPGTYKMDFKDVSNDIELAAFTLKVVNPVTLATE